jgi:hypothetical protein
MVEEEEEEGEGESSSSSMITARTTEGEVGGKDEGEGLVVRVNADSGEGLRLDGESVDRLIVAVAMDRWDEAEGGGEGVAVEADDGEGVLADDKAAVNAEGAEEEDVRSRVSGTGVKSPLSTGVVCMEC